MKKIITVLLSVVLAALCCACNPTKKPIEEEGEETVNQKTYQQLYDGAPKKRYDTVADKARHRASYGYSYNDTQGYNNWSYAGGTASNLTEMRYEAATKAWLGASGASICNGVLTASSAEKAAYIFTAPVAGKVTVSGTVRMQKAGSVDAQAKIYNNGVQVYPLGGSIAVDKADLSGVYVQTQLTLAQGDKLAFLLEAGSDVYFNPTVDYTNKPNETLYYVPEWGYYGDLHQYYYNDTVNLYHLRNMGENWIWYLEQSRDMFRYEEARNYTTEFVKDHYMAYGTMGDLNDYSIYPDGSRDMTQFFDTDVNKYRYFGLTYKQRAGNVNCDLSMRTSSDADGWVWDTPAIPLREFPTRADGEPECAFFRKMGNRWVLGAGISGQSKHGVGGLSYWMGAENANIDQTDWKTAQTYRLDGEDLAVPQIENVGGRWYLYGWMPQNYNGNQWGGYKNMPREVFVRENGLLGTRLDPMATKLLNRGKLTQADHTNMNRVSGNAQIDGTRVTATGNSRVAIQGRYDSSFVTYNLKLTGKGVAGFTMTEGGREYRLLVEKTDAGTFLKIDCPSDALNPVSSSLYLGDASMTDFNVKAVIEGGIVEFYVNDTLTLSGRTSMGSVYTAGLYASGNATFDNVVINRLAQLYDVYD